MGNTRQTLNTSPIPLAGMMLGIKKLNTAMLPVDIIRAANIVEIVAPILFFFFTITFIIILG